MICDPNAIDIIGERSNGGIELVIISSGIFDDSPAQQTLLLDKVENYLNYITSQQFKEDFPQANYQSSCIVLKSAEKPTPLLTELCKKIKYWTLSEGIDFKLDVC